MKIQYYNHKVYTVESTFITMLLENKIKSIYQNVNI